MSKMSKISLFHLDSSKDIAEKIAKHLGIKCSELIITKFKDGEILIKPKSSIRDHNVFLIAATSTPVNENIMKLLIAVDSIKRSSSKKINVIMPYFGYARQDRKNTSREPITCKLIANLLVTAGVDRVLLFDIHAKQSVGFFDCHVDNIKPYQLIAMDILKVLSNYKKPKRVCIVSPDHGGIKRAQTIAKFLSKLDNVEIALIDKRRYKANEVEVGYVLGNIKDSICFIVDDMIDTGGTISGGAEALKKAGAEDVHIVVTHGILSDPAKTRLSNFIKKDVIKTVTISDSIQVSQEKMFEGLRIFETSEFISNIISALIKHDSFTEVYNKIQSRINEKVENFKWK